MKYPNKDKKSVLSTEEKILQKQKKNPRKT